MHHPHLRTTATWTRLAQAVRCVAGDLERSGGELAAFQAARLRDLVSHAAAHVPLYRRKYSEAGIRPEQIRSLDDLRRLPLVTREELQLAGPEGCLTEGVDRQRLRLVRTSGSSGIPLDIWREPWEERTLATLRLRKLHAAGMPMAGRLVNFSGRVGEAAHRHSRFEPLRVHLIDCRQPPEQMLEQLLALRPDAVGGYSGVAADVARFIGPRERTKLSVRSVIAGGETLTEAARRAIENGFEVPFRNYYGSIESRLIALEGLERQDMTVNEGGVIVEILDGDRPAREGETGEVVITALHSFSMPFIRYRLLDLAERGADGAGGPRTTGSLRQVQGRLLDMFRLPGGGRLHPYNFTFSFIAKVTWMRHFRIVQEAVDSFRMDVAPMPGASPEQPEIDELARLMRSVTSEPIRVEVRLVEEIRPQPGGKYRVYVPLAGKGPST